MSHYMHGMAVGPDFVFFPIQLIPVTKDGVSPLYMPYIEFCGTVKSFDDLMGTFSIDAHQYISCIQINFTFWNIKAQSSFQICHAH